MRTRSSTQLLWQAIAAIALLLLTPGLRPAAAGSAGSIGGPSVGPVAGPIEVFTAAEALSSPLGSLLETTILVENSGSDPATVLLRGLITWPDGSQQLLRYGPPVTIDPDGAFILTALSPVPPAVGSGTGTFTAFVFVGSLGQGGHKNYPGQLIARSSSPFLLP